MIMRIEHLTSVLSFMVLAGGILSMGQWKIPVTKIQLSSWNILNKSHTVLPQSSLTIKTVSSTFLLCFRHHQSYFCDSELLTFIRYAPSNSCRSVAHRLHFFWQRSHTQPSKREVHCLVLNFDVRRITIALGWLINFYQNILLLH